MPKVSVIMPAYNAEAYIGESIQSILDQEFTDLELLVLNDASTDGTAGIVRSFEDPRLRLVQNERNLGIAGTRNRGISLTDGEYVAWQDADDISLPQRIGHQVALLDSRPEVGIVGGHLAFFGRTPSLRKYATDDHTLRSRIFRYSPVAQPAAMLRRSVLVQAGSYDSRLEPAEDLDMAFRLGAIARFANLDEVVLRYRESTTQATSRRLRKIERSTLQMRWHYRRLGGYSPCLLDWAYNLAQAGSMWLIPAPLRIALFNRIRNAPVPVSTVEAPP